MKRMLKGIGGVFPTILHQAKDGKKPRGHEAFESGLILKPDQ